MIYNFKNNSQFSFWAQERLILIGELITADVILWSSEHGSQAAPIAVYTPDATGNVTVDVTDYLRAYSGQLNDQITLYLATGASTYTHLITTVGLINPANVLAPANNYPDLKIICPSVMLAPILSSTPIMFEISNENMYEFATGRIKELPSETITNFARTNTLLVTTTEIELWHLADRAYASSKIKELDDCKNYVAVEWVSFTGVKRRHTFEVRKRKTSTDGAFDLLAFDNEYARIKGRVDGFDLYLDELDAYDVWYYSDIITSSDVRVSFDGKNWARVDVTAKNYTLPDGDAEKNGKIQISVNYKKYDAVAM